MSTLSQHQDQFRSLYHDHSAQLVGIKLPWLQAFRQKALDNLARCGLPKRKDEDWRYTNIRSIAERQFIPASNSGLADANLILQQQFDDSIVLVFVDGHFQAQLSNLSAVPSGIILCSMAEALQQHPALVEQYLGTASLPTLASGTSTNGFTLLNMAFFNDGLFLHLDQEVHLDTPIQLIYYGATANALISVRNLIIAQAQAKAQIVETWIGSKHSYLSNVVTEVIAAEHAQIEICSIQDEGDNANHISTVFSQQAAHAVFSHHNFNVGGLLVRNNILPQLGEHAVCHLYGLVLANAKQHIDNLLKVEHLKPHTSSHIQYKNIIDQQAHGVFQGCVIVHPDAQKTDSDMSNRNLLLSDEAEIDTKPQLVIDADDVKCAHGVTVGALEQDAIFYLQSRGIDAESARNILTFAFANELVEHLQSDALKQLVLAKLIARFPPTTIRRDWL
jgi:Fe-S cluster assembly protein SufD